MSSDDADGVVRFTVIEGQANFQILIREGTQFFNQLPDCLATCDPIRNWVAKLAHRKTHHSIGRVPAALAAYPNDSVATLPNDQAHLPAGRGAVEIVDPSCPAGQVQQLVRRAFTPAA